MKKIRFLSAFLCLLVIVSLAMPAFAANESYSFSLSNTGTAFQEDEYGNTNLKTQPNDPATIYCSSTNAPGWGYYLHLMSTDRSVQTYNYWYNNTNNLRHPTYTDQSSADQKLYFIRGRIDNDYNGTYVITGKFNADYTNP